MSMKITILSTYFVPERTAMVHLVNNLAEDFSFLYRSEVTVVTGFPSRGIDELLDINSIEIINSNLKIIRSKDFKEKRQNFLLRTTSYLAKTYHLYKIAKQIETDIYYIYSTPPFMGIAGALLSRKAPTVYNLQDVFPDSLITAKNLREDSLIIRLFRKVEKWIYKKNTHIITITQDFKKLLLERGVPKGKISTVYNWIDEKEVVPIKRHNNSLLDRYNIKPDNFLVTYCGNIGHSQNLEMVVDIAKELVEDNIQFIFIGDGGWRKNIEQYIANQKVLNVMMLPFQPYEEIAHVMSLGDVSLVCSKANVGNSSFPSKTWSIMSAGRAVVCSFDKNSELCEIINTAKAGLCSDAGDKTELKNNILRLYMDRKLTEELGKNGRKYIEENLTRQKATRKYFDILSKIVDSSKGVKHECK